MAIKYLTQRAAQAIDVELMSPTGGGFCFEQLVELAGLSVAQAITKEYSKESHPRVVVFSGPGNNGLDGLVAARHLSHFGYQPKVYYPKRPDKPVNQGLMKQCTELNIPFVDSPESGLHDSDLIVDAIFGFSFSGEVRQPFVSAIQALKNTTIPIVSVDIPSAWDVEKGNIHGEGFQPSMLVSLTAPKEGAKDFNGKHHYLGGRFISRKMEEKWGLNLPQFPGTDQCVRLNTQ
ncbi:YjeF N-terminal domain-like protein [Linnemannia elongata AG-77]|uniref:NAD(P)H-hydrate epimerase n=1 Tax=Linnemannia elongata AG-77 TaxID=1314771 RepID=A0A197JC95_9FUNG|nr:YjeF N-terminal domain-like protein [Linnemannia elongata AG-77]